MKADACKTNHPISKTCITTEVLACWKYRIYTGFFGIHVFRQVEFVCGLKCGLQSGSLRSNRPPAPISLSTLCSVIKAIISLPKVESTQKCFEMIAFFLFLYRCVRSVRNPAFAVCRSVSMLFAENTASCVAPDIHTQGRPCSAH